MFFGMEICMWIVVGVILAGLMILAASPSKPMDPETRAVLSMPFGYASAQEYAQPVYTITLCTRTDNGPIICPKHHTER